MANIKVTCGVVWRDHYRRRERKCTHMPIMHPEYQMHFFLGKKSGKADWGIGRVTRGRCNPILSPSHRVVEQQLLFPGFLPEFLETSGDQENLIFLEKVATTGD